MGKLAINNAGEYFQDSQSLMKHKQIRLSLTTTRSSRGSVISSYTHTHNGLTQLHQLYQYRTLRSCVTLTRDNNGYIGPRQNG